MKIVSKNNRNLAQGRVCESCLGPYICISVNTKLEKISYESMLFVNKMKSRGSDIIIYGKLFT